MTVITECITRFQARQGVPYGSKSNPDRSYHAYMGRSDDAPFCDCMPYLRGRKKAAEAAGLPNDNKFAGPPCQHLKDLFQRTCDFTTTDRVVDNVCPECSQPLVYVETSPDDPIGRLVDEPDVSFDEAGEELLALARDLAAP